MILGGGRENGKGTGEWEGGTHNLHFYKHCMWQCFFFFEGVGEGASSLKVFWVEGSSPSLRGLDKTCTTQFNRQ